jgi:hypothetical protein
MQRRVLSVQLHPQVESQLTEEQEALAILKIYERLNLLWNLRIFALANPPVMMFKIVEEKIVVETLLDTAVINVYEGPFVREIGGHGERRMVIKIDEWDCQLYYDA